MLGLHFSVRAFSSCSKRGPLFIAVRGSLTIVASLLQSTGSRRAGSAIVAHGPSCSGACGIFPDQGSNPCPLHWQVDSQPLRHQGSPEVTSYSKTMWELFLLPFLYLSLFSFFFASSLFFLLPFVLFFLHLSLSSFSFLSISLSLLLYFLFLLFLPFPLPSFPPSCQQILLKLFCARRGASRSGVSASASELCLLLPPLQALGTWFLAVPWGARREGAWRGEGEGGQSSGKRRMATVSSLWARGRKGQSFCSRVSVSALLSSGVRLFNL